MNSQTLLRPTADDPSNWVTSEQARELFPAKSRRQRVSVATIKRWHAKGIRGVRLRAWKVGGRWHTSRLAVREFIDQSNGVTGNGSERPKPDARSRQRMRRILEQDGFIDGTKTKQSKVTMPRLR